MQGLTRFGVSIPTKLLQRFDRYCRKRSVSSRSEALRDLIRDALVHEELEAGREMIGSLTLVYDHHVREITETLTDFQHRHSRAVISTVHVHLDHRHCLEVIILKGTGPELRRFADRVLGLRGVRHGKLVVTATPAA